MDNQWDNYLGEHEQQPGLKTHPWHGFASPHHTSADAEHVVRTLRFAAIQLSKFWIEIQSIPVLNSAFKSPSVAQLEKVSEWARIAPDWKRLVQDPRHISAILSPTYRKVLISLISDVEAVSSLREKISSYQAQRSESTQNLLNQMNSALMMLQQLNLNPQSLKPEDVDQFIAKAERAINQLSQVSDFMAQLTSECGIPQARNLESARLVFTALRKAQETSRDILEWRIETILSPENREQILALKKRANELVLAQESLNERFKPDLTLTPSEIRKAAESLKSAGMLSLMDQQYKAARQLYLNIAINAEKTPKLQMAEQLEELAGHLEAVEAFNTDETARSVFGDRFQGLQTDFARAEAANSWSINLRSSFHEAHSFAVALLNFIMSASEETIRHLSSQAERAGNIQAMVDSLSLDAKIDLQLLKSSFQQSLDKLTTLKAILDQVSAKPEHSLASLTEVKTLAEQILAIEARMIADPNLQSLMKNDYQGADTDLTPIRQCLAYIQFIETSEIPVELKSVLLTTLGPQRLMETKHLLTGVQAGLMATKEHLIKVESVTHFQPYSWSNYGSLFEVPIPALITRMNQALKQPELFQSFTELLREGRC